VGLLLRSLYAMITDGGKACVRGGVKGPGGAIPEPVLDQKRYLTASAYDLSSDDAL
jgi:hypothetical protein